MASLSDADEDDMELLMKDYCMPTMAEMTTDSLLTKSQYAKVIFHDLLASYPTDADIWCRYSVTDGITVGIGDKVALFRVGWSSVNEHLLAVTAPIPVQPEENEFQIRLKAELLPKDIREFYQLCYVSAEGFVCGASVPFQFRRPDSGELREVEEQGLLVVRSQTAIHANELERATNAAAEQKAKIADMERESGEMSMRLHHTELSLVAAQQDLLQLVAEKGDLSRKNDQLTAAADEAAFKVEDAAAVNKDLVSRIEEMSQRIVDLTMVKEDLKLKMKPLLLVNKELKENNEEFVLKNAELIALNDNLSREKVQHDLDMQLQREWARGQSRSMEALVLTVNDEKAELCMRLEETTWRADKEAERLRAQLDGLQQMLDVSSQSKEMAAQALRSEQAKASQLEEELAQQTRRHGDEMAALETQLRDTRLRLEALAETSAQDKRDLSACRLEAAKSAAAAARLRLESGFDPLLDEYEDMRRRAEMLAEENQALTQLRRENADLQKQVHQAAQESAGLSALEAENGALRAENGTLGRQLQQLRVAAALRKRREVDADQREAGLAGREAEAAAHSAEHAAKFEALDTENKMLVSRIKEMEGAQESWTTDSLRNVTSLIQANEELMLANVGLTQTNAKLTEALEAAKASANGTWLHESPGCLDLSLTLKVMELQNRKGDAEMALAAALITEEEAWERVKSAQEALAAMEKLAQEAELDLLNADQDVAFAEGECAKLTPPMQSLQEAMLRQDAAAIEKYGDEDDQQARLHGMLSRWHIVNTQRMMRESRRHDLLQDAAVRGYERRELAAAAARADADHKEAVRAKRALLETLVALDNRALALTAGTAAQQAADAGREALSAESKASSEEERLVQVYRFEGAAAHSEDGARGGEAPQDGASLNLTSAEWELVNPKKAKKMEDGGALEASELCLRLDLAAIEYRKLFVENAHLKKQLAGLEKQKANPPTQA